MAVVDSGTKIEPEPKPLRMMAHRNDHCEMSRVACPNHRLATPNIRKPQAISQRLSILLVRSPITGMARIAPMPRGLTAHPAAKAVYPSSSW